jgi:hypothetical protein
MHALLRDTEVSVQNLRKHRLRAVPPEPEQSSAESQAPAIAYPYRDPGDTLAPASAVQVRLREAIVRRNHQPRAIPRGPIQWARSSDRAVSVKRSGGALQISGRSAGWARISIGIDGLAYHVAVPPHQSPPELIAERLASHYQAEIVEQSDGSHHVVVTASLSHT